MRCEIAAINHRRAGRHESVSASLPLLSWYETQGSNNNASFVSTMQRPLKLLFSCYLLHAIYQNDENYGVLLHANGTIKCQNVRRETSYRLHIWLLNFQLQHIHNIRTTYNITVSGLQMTTIPHTHTQKKTAQLSVLKSRSSISWASRGSTWPSNCTYSTIALWSL